MLDLPNVQPHSEIDRVEWQFVLLLKRERMIRAIFYTQLALNVGNQSQHAHAIDNQWAEGKKWRNVKPLTDTC
jgi:hypothetical protein